jgi:ribonuclease E
MKQAILISREGGETRCCLLLSGKLVNIDAEGPSGGTIVGNIYKGIITDISRSLNAAFVNYGKEKEGFLSIHDVHPAILENLPRNPHMRDIFSKGQEILIQATRDPIGDKGATLTTCISLPGRFIVLVPAGEKTGISRKLPDDERKRLREIMADIKVPDGFGVIVRTAGRDRKKQELLKDVNQLISLWQSIEELYGKVTAPSLVLQEQGLAVRYLREYLTPEVDEILVDDADVHEGVGRFLALVMPRMKEKLHLYKELLPLFARYNVESQVQNMFLRDVSLPSGGRIVIDRTEALVAIDVNSGRQRGKDAEETATRTNLEAAEEIASQLLLRDLGGLIVIDFIDMDKASNRTAVQQHLKECMRNDKAKFNIGRISQFGLLEMTRQKLRSGFVSQSTEPCPHCEGLGYLRTASSNGLQILRKVRELAVADGANVVRVCAPVAVANFMQNSLRNLINKLEVETGVKVVIESDPSLVKEKIELSKVEGEQREQPHPIETPYYEAPIPEAPAEAPPEPEAAAVEPPTADQPAGGEPPPRSRRGRRRKGERGPAAAPAKTAGGPQPAPPKARPPAGRQERERPVARPQKPAGKPEKGPAGQPEKGPAGQPEKGPAGQPEKGPAGQPAGEQPPRRDDRRRGRRKQRTDRQAETSVEPLGEQPLEGSLEESEPPARPLPPPLPVPALPQAEPLRWDDPARDGLIDKVLKKLLGLDR